MKASNGWKIGILLLLFLLFGEGFEGYAQRQQDSLRRQLVTLIPERGDSLTEARNQQFFDSLQTKARRRKVFHLLYELLVTSPTPAFEQDGKVINESNRYLPFKGRTIRSIQINREDVFDPNGNWLERAGNTLHILTSERVIMRDLLLKVGDKIDPEQLVRNMQLLRSRSYISEADLKVVPVPGQPHLVDVVVNTRDSWTITVDGRLRGSGKTSVSISDDNIFGWGNRLEITTNFSRRDWTYGGNVIEYKHPNMWGSFIEGTISLGRDFSESKFQAEFAKPLIQPTDFLFGVSFNRFKSDFEDDLYPTIHNTLERRLDAWGGYSHTLPGVRANLYTMLHYQYRNFGDRPPVMDGFNPAYHRREEILGSVGLYREKFYTANMVYGYGTREYIATGYRAEILGGYNWGEFHEGFYVGYRFNGGRFTSYGYFGLGSSLGGYIKAQNGSWHHGVGRVDFLWFSNLLPVRECNVRQFVKLNYTHGWNRGEGYNETISFSDNSGIRIMEDSPSGLQRLSINTETVVFTPLQPWGFRITCYGFADMGVIGPSHRIGRNSLYGSVGIGVRIRNERLIFGAIQFQLGIAFGKGGWAESDWIELTSQNELQKPRYMPSAPTIVPFD